jgi:NTP pyrophosphatase (non-canonical NTP hydrolase)
MGYMTDGLTFNTLRGGNLARLPQFKDAQGRLSHPGKDGEDWSLNDWMTAVTGEAGELANLLKKVRRGDFTLEEKRGDIADELADVAIYLDILAMRCGVDLGRAIMSKFNRTSERVGSSIRIDAEDWHNDFNAAPQWCSTPADAKLESDAGEH